MALTSESKVSVRRHLCYPVIGLITTSPAGGALASGFIGYRFFQTYGRLEFKMNNLDPVEESILLGNAIGAVALIGPQPNAGDTVSVTLSNGNIASPQTITATAPAPVNGVDARLTLCNLLASAAQLNPVLQAAGILAVTPFGTGPYSQQAIPVPQVAFESPVSFTITSSGSGALYPQITSHGTQLPPVASLASAASPNISTPVYGYLPILDVLEGAYAAASGNLDTIQADVWKGRSNELGQRYSLYRMWQGRLADFLGVPLDPDRTLDAKRHGALSYA